jgi:CTP synthase (UTP-ammonia lyase)
MWDADHEESAPDAQTHLISKLACSLVGKRQIINLKPGSMVQRAYQRETVEERYVCSYGLNPRFCDKFETGSLKITGVDPNGDVRAVEASNHPFFMATLFQPQLSSEPGQPNPLIVEFLKAASAFQASGGERS